MTLTAVNSPDLLDPSHFFPVSAIPCDFIPSCLQQLTPENAAVQAVEDVLQQLVDSDIYQLEEQKWNLDRIRTLIGNGPPPSSEKLFAELFNRVSDQERVHP